LKGHCIYTTTTTTTATNTTTTTITGFVKYHGMTA